jgi:AraC-like DNA-binding protein
MKLTTREDYLERIRRVLRFVQEHLDETLTPARLAEVAHLSRTTSTASSAASSASRSRRTCGG